jgi:hypothetical protein
VQAVELDGKTAAAHAALGAKAGVAVQVLIEFEHFAANPVGF